MIRAIDMDIDFPKGAHNHVHFGVTRGSLSPGVDFE